VILVDVNILIYASIPTLQQHLAAQEWLDRQLNASAPVGMPWVTVLAYLRLVTNARIFKPPVAMATAWQRVSAWLARDVVWIPAPTERHAQVLGSLLAQPGVLGNLVTDAHLAALAIEHGLTLCSTDGDFARFTGLRWQNPLAAAP
jgi:toxin-antitoxin system PIN domain toxin